MPDKPVVFLSSTISPLKELRAAITEKIEELGYEVRVAEYDFPAPPNMPVSERCLQNVDKCHILILIIDGSYGTPVNGEWLVRSEFLRAKDRRKAVYVMVEEHAWDRYNLAKGRPEVDSLDIYKIHPKVVSFLREIEESGQDWIRTYNNEKDLGRKLKEQFSAHYAELLHSQSEALLIRAAHLLEQMHYLYRQKNHVQSLLFAKEVLRIDPDNPEALVTGAVCRIRLHGLSEVEYINQGIADCTRVIDKNPRDYRARYNRANFKLLSPKHSISEVEKDLKDLYKDFSEYESYFENDPEFKQMLDLRKSWTGWKDPSETKDKELDSPGT